MSIGPPSRRHSAAGDRQTYVESPLALLLARDVPAPGMPREAWVDGLNGSALVTQVSKRAPGKPAVGVRGLGAHGASTDVTEVEWRLASIDERHGGGVR